MTNNFHFKNIPVHTVHVNWVNFLKQQADIPYVLVQWFVNHNCLSRDTPIPS